MSAAGAELFRLLAGGAAERRRQFRVEIPSSSPLFAGHFPGRPILPGIAHLALVERVLCRLAAVRSVKLRRPVAPGDVLELSVHDPEADGWIRFELRCGDETVSSGAVQTRQSGGTEGEAVEPALPADTDLPAVEELLPHAPPARFVRDIHTISEEEIVCTAEIPQLHPLAEGSRLPAFVGIEAGAQAAAVLEALNRRQDTAGPRIGYLVGVRRARFAASLLPAGRPLRVAARLHGGAFPLSIYDIAVGEPGREILTGTISTFITRGE